MAASGLILLLAAGPLSAAAGTISIYNGVNCDEADRLVVFELPQGMNITDGICMLRPVTAMGQNFTLPIKAACMDFPEAYEDGVPSPLHGLVLAMYIDNDTSCAGVPENPPGVVIQTQDAMSASEGSCTVVRNAPPGDGQASIRITGGVPVTPCAHDDDDDDGGMDGNITCGMVRELYKDQNCCGNPNAPFTTPGRRLSAAKKPDDIIAEVRAQLSHAKKTGGPARVKELIGQLNSVVGPYRGGRVPHRRGKATKATV